MAAGQNADGAAGMNPLLRRPIVRPRRPRRPRKPDASRFTSAAFSLPDLPENKALRNGLFLFALVAAGVAIGAFWPEPSAEKTSEDDVFVMEEEIPLPPPEPPQSPPMPEPPPKVEIAPEPPPPPQFGLDEGDLSETGDLAVGAGNTLMKEAEAEVKPPAPPLPPAPTFVDQPPGILHGDPPEYPARALDRGLEGTVVALITIDTAGNVTHISIEKSAGSDFDQSVLKSARATRFQPPIRNGRKLAARFRRPYEFRLEE